jgi:tRNA A37 threonylcarbamoyladenosine modification protein TsaB
MYVLIDPSEREQFVFFTSTDLVVWSKVTFPRALYSTLLTALNAVLEPAGLSALKGLAVKVGKGSFTTDRIAVTTVNMLVLSQQIPAVAVAELDFEDISRELKSLVGPAYIVARYSGPPNVGTQAPYLH